MTTTPLPPLPKARFLEWGKPATPAYTAAEMQAYATAACADLEAENKRLRAQMQTIKDYAGNPEIVWKTASAALKDTK